MVEAVNTAGGIKMGTEDTQDRGSRRRDAKPRNKLAAPGVQHGRRQAFAMTPVAMELIVRTLGAFVVVLLAIVAGLASYTYFGFYNVAASEQDWDLVRWSLETGQLH
jgi:hypothetical protein